MKKIISLLVLLFVTLEIVVAQQNAKIKIDVAKGPNPWNNLVVNNSEATFQFAIVTDRTGGHRPGVFLDGVNKLNLLQPEFVMSVGDLIEGYTKDTAQLNREWKEFTGFIDNLQMPFFYLPGNHDMTNEVMAKKWEELFGKSYYHFLYKDVLFLCLNSEDNYRGAGRGTIDDEQYKYIEKVLSENESAKWTLVFMHQPLWNQDDTKRWKDVEKLLEKRKHTVFVGHNHRYQKYERNNGKYFVLATTGGGSALRGPDFGEFDHVVWITMTDDGPIIANLLLEGIWDENVMSEELAKFVMPISQNLPIKIFPAYIDDPEFKEVVAPMKITNETDVAMRAEVQFLSSKNLMVTPISYNDTINPNDVKEIELHVQGVGIHDYHEMDGLEMEVKLIYGLENNRDIEMKETFTVKPALRYTILPSKKAISIDGEFDDWKNLNFALDKTAVIKANPFSHAGTDDASANFAVKYDDKFLYVAAKVIDDDIYVKENGNPLYQDAGVIYIDARPSNNCNKTTPANLFSEWMVIAISPDANTTVYQKNKLPKGTKYKLKKTSSGYNIEVAVPIEYLNLHQGVEWKDVRINFMINDYDQQGHHQSRISWKPVWIEQDNYFGSGTFFRE